jgi:hypothetical protein
MCYLWESLLYTIGTIDREALEYLQLESLAIENAGNQGNVVILRKSDVRTESIRSCYGKASPGSSFEVKHTVSRKLPTVSSLGKLPDGRALHMLKVQLILLLVGDSFHPQELFNTPVPVESPKSTCLRTAMR